MSYNLFNIIIVIGFLMMTLFDPAISKEKIIVTSDQPVIIGSNVTFTATLKHPEQPNYDIAWQEITLESYRHQQDVLNKSNGYQSNWTLSYADSVSHLRPGTYSVTASVSYTYVFFNVNVGTVVSDFNLTRDFSGTLDVLPSDPSKKDPSYVSTLNETELAVKLHDPYNYLGMADNVTWSWFNQSGFMANTSTPSFKKNITKEGNYAFNVSLTAIYNSSAPTTTVTKRGFFHADVTAKIPVVNFTVSGETWFPQGRLLNLKVLCDGSKPYTYCFHMISGPYNLTGNETCDSPTVTNDCEIPFVWYFSDPGLNSLVIIMENDVSRVVNRTLVNVYKVSKKQPLSIIIVPITCTLVALVMIIFGIAYFWENRAKFSVEVADFDFGHSDELPYMTFMERLKDAMTSTASTRQRLYHPPDDEPILSSRRASQFS